jgi:anti-sigma B factor antagonist
LELLGEIYRIFMVPKPIEVRLFTNMENMNIQCELSSRLVGPAALELDKESKLKLSVEAHNHGDVIVVRCQGRVVYRDEAAALSRVVGEVLHQGSKLVLDLSGVSAMDSAGIGELALLQTWAQERQAELKCVVSGGVVRTLLDITNLDSVLEVHDTFESALQSFRSQLANEFAA